MTVEQIGEEIQKISKLQQKESHYILKCKYFHNCCKNKEGTCVGCSMWNLFYDQYSLALWCNLHHVDLISTIIELSKAYGV